MNRFVKHNQALITVLAVVGAIAFLLLVYCGIVIYQVGDAYSRTSDCSKEIIRLRRKHPSPVEANRDPIREDAENYRKSALRLGEYFGNPYQIAADRFVTTLLNVGDPAKLPDARREFIRAYKERVHDGSNGNSEFIAFRESYNENGRWDEATKEFVKAVNEIIPDVRLGNDADRIALAELGLPYRLQNTDMMQRYLDNSRERFSESVPVQKDAQDFGLAARVDGSYDIADYPWIVGHLDVIGDMMRRIGQAKIDTLNAFCIVGGIPEKGRPLEESFERRGALRVARYVFEVSGKLEAVRDLVSRFGAATSERRMYAIRSIYLYAQDSDVAKAQAQINPKIGAPEGDASAENMKGPIDRREKRRLKARKAREAEEARQREEAARKEEQLPMHQRRGYGETLFGGNRDCRAIFDVEYVIFDVAENE